MNQEKVRIENNKKEIFLLWLLDHGVITDEEYAQKSDLASVVIPFVRKGIIRRHGAKPQWGVSGVPPALGNHANTG